MDKQIKELLNKEKDTTIEVIDDMHGKITATDYFNVMAKDIDAFDKRAWENKEGYDTPKFPSIAKNLEGWSNGNLYVFAGPSNAGKTGVMINILEDLVMTSKNKLFGLYFSIDDSKNKVIPRFVAMRESLPIGIVAKPGRFKMLVENGDPNSLYYQECLDKRQVGLDNLRRESSKLMIVDGSEVRNIEDIKEYTKQVQNYVKAIDPDANVVVCIDSLKDIEVEGNLSTNEKAAIVATEIKALAVKQDIMVLASMHLRKLNGNRRPTLDDISDSATLVYELSVCFLVYNDVSANKQAAKIFHRQSEDTEKLPIIELDWAKNKESSYKGRTFCYFSPEFSKAKECNEENTKRFNALLYEA